MGPQATPPRGRETPPTPIQATRYTPPGTPPEIAQGRVGGRKILSPKGFCSQTGHGRRFKKR
eukprot:533519-Amphidinium_carterae.1